MFSLVPISGSTGCETGGNRFPDMICHDFIQSTGSQVSLHIRTCTKMRKTLEFVICYFTETFVNFSVTATEDKDIIIIISG